MESATTVRKLALAGGVLYILTFAFSLPTLGMKEAIVDNPAWVLGNGSDSSVIWASLFDFLTGLTGIGTAVALWPITKRYSKTAALGFVTTRVLEAAILVIGAISLLSIVSLKNAPTGDTGAMLTTSHALVAVHDWSFLFGPGMMAVFNALCLATIMYRSGLVPRWIPTLGLIGAPLLFASDIGVLFDMHGQSSATAMLMVLPIATWEFSLGVYLTFKGFKTKPVADNEAIPVAFVPAAA
jgi:hypothetical protein